MSEFVRPVASREAHRLRREPLSSPRRGSGGAEVVQRVRPAAILPVSAFELSRRFHLWHQPPRREGESQASWPMNRLRWVLDVVRMVALVGMGGYGLYENWQPLCCCCPQHQIVESHESDVLPSSSNSGSHYAELTGGDGGDDLVNADCVRGYTADAYDADGHDADHSETF